MKLYYLTYTMDYYISLKKDEIMKSAATWMGLEDITLKEVSL